MLPKEKWQVDTIAVLEEVFDERCRQMRQHGTAMTGLPDGTGPDVLWLPTSSQHTATEIQKIFRLDYDIATERGQLSKMHLVREEVAEVFQESDPSRLRAELLQVAALCVQWVEILRKENSPDR
jgi:hypothetical protein